METFLEIIKILLIGVFALIALFLVLIAMPKSQLRSVMLEVFGWGTAATCAVGVVSPIDLVPDVIPVIGQMDDLGMLVIGIISAIFAYYQRQQRLKVQE